MPSTSVRQGSSSNGPIRSATPVELPDMDSMGARWDRYLESQDMIGYDRAKVGALGHQYLSRAVEESG